MCKLLGQENELLTPGDAALFQAGGDLPQSSHLTAMTSLAATIAHEIIQPLTSIVAEAEAGLRWLDRPQADLKEVAEGLQSIRDSGQRAAGIVRALRSLARQAPAALAPVRLDDLVTDVLRLNRCSIEARGVALVTELGIGDRTLEADPVQLQQVIFNLLANAADAVSETGRAGRIVVRSVSDGPFAAIIVADDGPGIPQDRLGTIFEPFVTTKSTGMGMGLAICRSILAVHGGALEVHTEEGVGTVFTARVPWRTAEQDSTRPRAPDPDRPRP